MKCSYLRFLAYKKDYYYVINNQKLFWLKDFINNNWKIFYEGLTFVYQNFFKHCIKYENLKQSRTKFHPFNYSKTTHL